MLCNAAWQDSDKLRESSERIAALQPATNIQRHNYVASENWPCRTAQSDGIFQTVAKGKSHLKAKAKLESFARQYIINHFNGRRAPSCLHLTLPSVFLRVFSMLSARLLVPSVHDDDLRCFLVV
jgi:hypothetical protein